MLSRHSGVAGFRRAPAVAGECAGSLFNRAFEGSVSVIPYGTPAFIFVLNSR